MEYKITIERKEPISEDRRYGGNFTVYEQTVKSENETELVRNVIATVNGLVTGI